MDRKELIEKFQKALQGKVEAAYFFGSFARGDVHRDSDLDLILILKNPHKDFLKRAEDFFFLQNIFPALDLLIYTPEEFEAKNKNEIQGFWPQMKKDLLKII